MYDVFVSFLVEKALILIPALWIIGYVLKKTPAVPDWLIPYVLLPIGAMGGLLLVGGVEGVIQGILAVGAAVLGNQLLVQLRKR